MKAEAAKCVLCIPVTGLRAWEFSRSSAQANARQKKKECAGSVQSIEAVQGRGAICKGSRQATSLPVRPDVSLSPPLLLRKLHQLLFSFVDCCKVPVS